MGSEESEKRKWEEKVGGESGKMKRGDEGPRSFVKMATYTYVVQGSSAMKILYYIGVSSLLCYPGSTRLQPINAREDR
jgi:hypothetical protein